MLSSINSDTSNSSSLPRSTYLQSVSLFLSSVKMSNLLLCSAVISMFLLMVFCKAAVIEGEMKCVLSEYYKDLV